MRDVSAPKPVSTLKAGHDGKTIVYVPSSSLTVREVQDKIPAQYFRRLTGTSLLYLLRDVVQVAVTYAVMYHVLLPALLALEQIVARADVGSTAAVALCGAARAVVWGVFWFVQGLNGTALWVLAHECGHQAFSPMRELNNFIGLTLHSALLVPYHSWRLTHGAHHKHTNHLTKDTVFVPDQADYVMDVMEDAPLVVALQALKILLFGWPAHLFVNATGQKYDRRANHFEPSSPLFRREDAGDVILSDLGLLVTLTVLGMAMRCYGTVSVLCWYGIPYLWVNAWLVYITFMQHTDLRIPHYTHEHWTFVRGAIAAVDRDYGAPINAWLHHINDSHVVHHMFSQVPFYHAIIITRKHIKDILGDTYITDSTPLIRAIYQTIQQCRYVVPSEGVSVFHTPNEMSDKST